jgi:hypothetical protein
MRREKKWKPLEGAKEFPGCAAALNFFRPFQGL